MEALKRLNIPQTFRDLGYIDQTLYTISVCSIGCPTTSTETQTQSHRKAHSQANVHRKFLWQEVKIWRTHNAVSLCVSFAFALEDWLQFVAFDPQKLVRDFISTLFNKI